MDKSEAEDLYQQTFLKALEMEWTLDWGQNPKALFFSLTHNLWKSDRRKQARRNMIAPCSNLDDEAETVLHSDESIEESYLQKELISEVNRIIETLPEKIRIPLTLLRMVIPKTFEIILGFAIFLVVFTKKISFSLAESYIPLKFMLLYIPYF